MGKRRYLIDVQLVASFAFFMAAPGHSAPSIGPGKAPATHKLAERLDQSECHVRTVAAKAVDTENVPYLRGIIAQTIAAHHPASQPKEIQGAVLFALDQTRSAPSATVAALDGFPLEGLSKNQVAAITNLRALRKTMLCGQGTGAASGDLSLTAGPDIGGGGVTSDYINP
jgi:hypothetical protein